MAVQVSGKQAVVLGRSNIVGMPVAHLLQSMDATVTVCHSRTGVFHVTHLPYNLLPLTCLITACHSLAL